MPEQTPIIRLNPKRVLFFLLAIVVILVGLSIYGQKIRFFGVADIRGPWHEFIMDHLMQSFFLDREGNITTFFNALLLFISSQLLAAIGMWKISAKDKYRFHWLGLSLILFFLAFDEASSIHETLIKPMRSIYGAESFFYFTWVIPGIVGVAALGLAYLTFFMHLERKFKLLFFLSLAVYLGGVIGGEMISGYVASSLGQKNYTYSVVASLEESIELVGCSLIIYTLLEYIKTYLPDGITFKL